MSNSLPPPSRSVGQATRGTFRALETIITRALNALNIRYSHFQILHILWEGDGITQGEIAKAAFITDSSFAQVISEMVKEGLVERRNDPSDARKRLVFLAPRGREVENITSTAILEIMNVALEGISEDEIEGYLSTSFKIRQNLTQSGFFRQNSSPPKKTA